MAYELEEEDVFRTNNDYQQRKLEVMDDDERNLAQKYLEFYRSAHQDKENRGLFDKWERIDLYWEGEANPPESDTDPASNTNIVNPNIEGQVAYLVEQNIAIEAKPRSPSDRPWRDRAVMTMEFVKERNRMKRKLDVHERRRKKFGTGIFRVLFDPDELDGMGLPIIQPCNPAYVFFDPTITDVYRYQEGRFVIEVVNRSLNYAREHYDEDLVSAIEPGYHPMEEDAFIYGEEAGETDDISRDSYLHMFVFTRYKKKDGERCLRLVEMSGCGVILRDTLEEEEKDEYAHKRFPSARYPYFLTPDMFREGTVWAKSTAELLIPTQDIVDDLDDQIRMNARATGNPQRELDINSGIDPEKITNEPGLVYPNGNGNNAIRNIEPPKMPEYIIARRNQALTYERTVVSRFSDQMNGIRQEGVDTATEALGLQQGGTQGINHSKLLLEETLAEVFEYCLELCMEYWTEEEFFELTEQPGEFDYFRPSDMLNIPKLMPADPTFKTQFASDFPNSETVPQYMPVKDKDGKDITKKIALDISVTVGAGMPSNKGFVFNMINQAMERGAITPQEYRKLLKEYVGLPVDEEPPVTQDQIAEMVQQSVAQALQAQMGAGMGMGMQTPSPMVQGLTAGNNPALSVVQGGGI